MHYLAYGSNLHPVRLVDRVPNARLVGTTALVGYRLTFHKRSVDGSAKCTLDQTNHSTDIAYTAVYSVSENDVHLLDQVEGLGNGYYKQQLSVDVNGVLLNTFSYFVSETHRVLGLQPYYWYKGFVLAGARKHKFPEHYIEEISAVTAKRDMDTDRRTKMENLLVQLDG